jgi:hypothetical protein
VLPHVAAPALNAVCPSLRPTFPPSPSLLRRLACRVCLPIRVALPRRDTACASLPCPCLPVSIYRVYLPVCLCLCLRVQVDLEDDINAVTAYFSYEHFYVLYCKFWELDVSKREEEGPRASERERETARERERERDRERGRVAALRCPPPVLGTLRPVLPPTRGWYRSCALLSQPLHSPDTPRAPRPLLHLRLQGDHDFLLSRSDLSRMSELTSVLLDREYRATQLARGEGSLWLGEQGARRPPQPCDSEFDTSMPRGQSSRRRRASGGCLPRFPSYISCRFGGEIT